jgi:hypothetical protein
MKSRGLISAIVLAGALMTGATGASATSRAGAGYWMVSEDGVVYAFGAASTCPDVNGDTGEDVVPGLQAVNDIAATPDGRGYWLLRAGVDDTYVGFHHCDLYGPSGSFAYPYRDYESNTYIYDMLDGEVATSISATPDGTGYWIFTNLGRVITNGSAGFYGDLRNVPLNGPILDSVATPSGLGYWMVASDGGVFSFGDAKFYGSMGGTRLNQPVTSMAPDPDGRGYWLVAADGGIFAFDAPFYGSMGSRRLNEPISGIVASPSGRGYLMVAFDGGIFSFGDVPFHGSLGGRSPLAPVVSVAVVP